MHYNIAAMYVLQLANYVIPFFTLPFLVRTLGTESFGLLAVSQSALMFLVTFVDAGFNQIAAREIAVVRHDRHGVGSIYWSTQCMRFGLAVAGSAVFAVAVLSVDAWRLHWDLFLAQGLMVVGTLVTPIWYFAGTEQMKFVATYSIAGRLAVSAAIFLFVREPADLLLAAALQASATLLSGIGLHLAHLRAAMPWQRPQAGTLRRLFRTGRPLFLSEFAINASSNVGVVLLGLFSTAGTAGAFAAVDKLVRAIESLFRPLLTGFAPRLARTHHADSAQGHQASIRLVLLLSVAALLCAALTAALAEPILRVLFGDQLQGAGWMLKWMSAALAAGISLLAIQELWLVPAGDYRTTSRLLALASALQIGLSALLVKPAGALGIIVALLASRTVAIAFAGAVARDRRRASVASRR